MTGLLSRLAPTNLITFGLIFLLIGIHTGLGLTGPFEYLDVQLELYASQQALIADYTLPPGHPILRVIAGVYDAFMRGVTIGYNAPAWVRIEHILLTGFYLLTYGRPRSGTAVDLFGPATDCPVG